MSTFRGRFGLKYALCVFGLTLWYGAAADLLLPGSDEPLFNSPPVNFNFYILWSNSNGTRPRTICTTAVTVAIPEDNRTALICTSRNGVVYELCGRVGPLVPDSRQGDGHWLLDCGHPKYGIMADGFE